MFENAGDAIFIAQDGVIKFPNHRVIDLVGYSVEELAQKPFIDLVHPADREMVLERYQNEIWAVDIDQGQIEQVLLNLYVNAWQAMPGGGDLFLQTANLILDEDDVKPYDVAAGRFVKISITDTGIGMDAATQQQIFDPFFTTPKKDRSTGMGLASAYGIISNHGGIICVYSEQGEGTTFNIYLPATDKIISNRNKGGC